MCHHIERSQATEAHDLESDSREELEDQFDRERFVALGLVV
ncbi:hypothetical protein ACYJ1Y_14260 [Natrialbaceae archaeon A-gly3]